MRSRGSGVASTCVLERVDAAVGPLLEEGGVELADAAEVGVEAAGGHAEPGAQVGHGQRVHAALGEQLQGGAVVVVLALAHAVPLSCRPTIR